MAAYSLESLVLRSVSVRGDGQTVGLCLGTNEAVRMPGVRIFMRHPSHGYPQANPNSRADRRDHDAKRVAATAAIGTGRSRGLVSRSWRSAGSSARLAANWRCTPQARQARFQSRANSGWRQDQRSGLLLERWLAERTHSPLCTVASSTADAVPTSAREIGVCE
jgi:hypothetical protein